MESNIIEIKHGRMQYAIKNKINGYHNNVSYISPRSCDERGMPPPLSPRSCDERGMHTPKEVLMPLIVVSGEVRVCAACFVHSAGPRNCGERAKQLSVVFLGRG